jgi:hypothetical protein
MEDLEEDLEDEESIPYISGSGEGLCMRARGAMRISRSI